MTIMKVNEEKHFILYAKFLQFLFVSAYFMIETIYDIFDLNQTFSCTCFVRKNNIKIIPKTFEKTPDLFLSFELKMY